MRKGGKLKGIFAALILLMLILMIVSVFLPDIITPAENVTEWTEADNVTYVYPTIIRTVFGLWWVPIGLLMIGVILAGTSKKGRSVLRRRRRRR